MDQFDLSRPDHQELLLTSLKAEIFSPCESELARLLKQLRADEYQHLASLTKKILDDENCDRLIPRWLSLIQKLDNWEVFLQINSSEIENQKKCIKKIFERKFAFDANQAKTSSLKSLKEAILNFLKIVIHCANLINLGKEPTNFIEAKTMLDVWHSFYLIPVAVFTALAFFLPPLISLGVTITVLSAVILSSYLYQKYASPLPESLPHCELIKPAEASPIMGREYEQSQIEKVFIDQSNSVFRCPLILGKPGIGKSSFARSLADKFPEKKVFYCNVSALISAQMNAAFSLISPLDQIKRKIAQRGQDILLILDEIHEAFEPQNKNFGQQLAAMIYNPSREGRVRCLGITTLELYQKTKENFSKQLTSISLGDRRFEVFILNPTDRSSTLTILRKRCEELSIEAEGQVLEKIFEFKDPNDTSSHPDLGLSIIESAHKKLISLQDGDMYLAELASYQRAKATIPFSLENAEENAHQLEQIDLNQKMLELKRNNERKSYQLFAKHQAILSSLHKSCYFAAEGSLDRKNEFLSSLWLGKFVEKNLSLSRKALPFLHLTEEILNQITKERKIS